MYTLSPTARIFVFDALLLQDYQTAVSELRRGQKQSHWIWYIKRPSHHEKM